MAIGRERQPEDGSARSRAGEVGEERERERDQAAEAGQWAGPQGGAQLVVGKEGMTGGPEPGKEKKKTESIRI
jgi:hypothetical protein